MKILPNTSLLVPTSNDVEGEGIDRLETARLLLERGFTRLDELLGGMTQTVVQDCQFDITTRHGDFVYLRDDGVFASALAENSVRKNVIGYADKISNKVILIGVIQYQFDFKSFQRGEYLYLSPRYQGELQVDIPVNSPEVLVGLYLGDGLIIINTSTAISSYLQKGIADGSITTEKLASNAISPFSKDVTFGVGLPLASELGQVSLTNPEYKGDANQIYYSSNYHVNSSVLNLPVDFNSGAVGILNTQVISNIEAFQLLWAVSDSDNTCWYRKKNNGTWTNWYSLTSSYDSLINKEIFYKTLLLGSQYEYCYYNTLKTSENIQDYNLPPRFDILNKTLIFSNVGEGIQFTAVSDNREFYGFRLVINEIPEEAVSASYAANGGLFKDTEVNQDTMAMFNTLTIRLVANSPFTLEHFGVLYSLQSKAGANADMLLLKDRTSGLAYKLDVVRGSLQLTPIA